MAVPPVERTPVESLGEEELVRRAIEERRERARIERMRIRPVDGDRLWADYLVTNTMPAPAPSRPPQFGRFSPFCSAYPAGCCRRCRVFGCPALLQEFRPRHQLDDRPSLEIRQMRPASAVRRAKSLDGGCHTA